MKSRIRKVISGGIAALAFFAMSVCAAAPLECSSAVGNQMSKFTIEMQKDEIRRFSFTNNQGTYTCDVAGARNDGKSEWRSSDGRTAVKLTGGEVDFERRGDKIDVYFKNFRAGYFCGTGATLPTKIVFTPKENRCLLKFAPEAGSQEKNRQKH